MQYSPLGLNLQIFLLLEVIAVLHCTNSTLHSHQQMFIFACLSGCLEKVMHRVLSISSTCP